MRVMGVDLAANPSNATAVATLDGRRLVALERAHPDRDIVALAARHDARLVAVDAPLAPPTGIGGNYANRVAERDLRRAGFKAMPPSRLGSLTFRGIALAGALRDAGFDVIEVFPRATLQRVGHALERGVGKSGRESIAGARTALAALIANVPDALPDDHAADAIAAALTAALHAEGATEPYGDPDEGVVWVPRGGVT